MSDPSEEPTIYIDGSCSGQGSMSSPSAGIGVFWEGQEKNNVSEPLEGRQTNQRAEIIAATRGIRQAKDLGYQKITVRTDSHYVKNAAETWIPNWSKKGWSKSIVNKEEFQELQESMSGINVRFEYVPSHLNAADTLARQGARRLAKIASICKQIR